MITRIFFAAWTLKFDQNAAGNGVSNTPTIDMWNVRNDLENWQLDLNA